MSQWQTWQVMSKFYASLAMARLARLARNGRVHARAVSREGGCAPPVFV